MRTSPGASTGTPAAPAHPELDCACASYPDHARFRTAAWPAQKSLERYLLARAASLLIQQGFAQTKPVGKALPPAKPLPLAEAAALLAARAGAAGSGGCRAAAWLLDTMRSRIAASSSSSTSSVSSGWHCRHALEDTSATSEQDAVWDEVHGTSIAQLSMHEPSLDSQKC